jgi:hypothetical protein
LRLGAGLEQVRSRLYYVYDPTLSDPPEAVVGERPAVGYQMTRWRSVPRGRYEIWMDTYILEGAAAADPRGAVRRLEEPVAIRVSP